MNYEQESDVEIEESPTEDDGIERRGSELSVKVPQSSTGEHETERFAANNT